MMTQTKDYQELIKSTIEEMLQLPAFISLLSDHINMYDINDITQISNLINVFKFLLHVKDLLLHLPVSDLALMLPTQHVAIA